MLNFLWISSCWSTVSFFLFEILYGVLVINAFIKHRVYVKIEHVVCFNLYYFIYYAILSSFYPLLFYQGHVRAQKYFTYTKSVAWLWFWTLLFASEREWSAWLPPLLCVSMPKFCFQYALGWYCHAVSEDLIYIASKVKVV